MEYSLVFVPQIGSRWLKDTRGQEVDSCASQAEVGIWAAANDVCIVVVLTVVFPPTDRANIVFAARVKCGIAATWAGIWEPIDWHVWVQHQSGNAGDDLARRDW